MAKHYSVLLNETIDTLNIKPDGIYVDLTLGRGGHSSEILKRLTSGKLIAFDKDQQALEESKERLEAISNNFELVHDDFRNIKDVLESKNINSVDGIIADLGVSSPQFDEGERGFSYNKDSYLDMRMDQSSKLTAYDVVNNYSLEELTKVFREYGEEKFSYQIARNIVSRRESKPIETTFELVEIIKASKPMKELKKIGHPAKQVFQALRIEVNDELGALKEVVKDAMSLLKVGGVFSVITFHSLEDRIVKVAFKEASTLEGDRLNIYTRPEDIQKPKFELVNSKPILPSEKELDENHRSASAKLRAIRRVSL